ncbi:nuclear export factor Sac3 [Schizosaccharomyces cryophilus OY26]|uniref:Nuclear mRNA export factor n=1 Tax=Schizosaccharomyces cryophilus (strain OY26 / ATCC MYA-4695 / CBS 11777 / NBRC 106824 / NRRL Y48691) TaxID=653667 RepID=S9XBQ7_SCHCR|nr:nuclear export factor Sac3 [Schizosaccharomyces cryophilus OY26]EPY51251.1 nuclear export factor Sac3 [Schizosaccharomyces cryophilus OY26]
MEKPDESGFSQLNGPFTREKKRRSFSHSQKGSKNDVFPVEEDESTTPEDVDAQETRQKRFTSSLQGNRFEELRRLRDKEREDAIQKGLIDDPSKPRQLDEAVTFVGTCPDMCPEYEREQREYQNNLERWEINPDSGRVDKNLAVKAFHRPAAGNEQALPSDVRPPPVLKKSLDYLIDKIVCGPYPLETTHFFVRDRTRSIRQDFTLQNNRSLEAVACHERIARYHILCLHQLCEKKNFSSQQEVEQLRKVLQSLCEFYDDLRKEKISCPNEAEFRSYSILTHLRDQDVVRQSQLLPTDIFDDPQVQLSLRLSALAQKNNERIGHLLPLNTEATPNLYTRFFKLVASSSVTYLMACLLESHFTSIRKGAIKAMRKAYMSVHAKFPCVDLQRILQFDALDNVFEFCEYYALEVYEENGEPVVNLSKTGFFDDSKPDTTQRFSHALVEKKLDNRSFAVIINGGTTSIKAAKSSVFKKDARPIFPVNKPISNVETRSVTNGSHKNSVLSRGTLNANAPVFKPGSSPSVLRTTLNTQLPRSDSQSLLSIPSEETITSLPPPVIKKPSLVRQKPMFSSDDLNLIFQSIVKHTLTSLCGRICKEVYEGFIDETAKSIYYSMVKNIIRFSSLKTLAIEICNSTLKKRVFSRITLKARECWLKKREREVQQLREQQQQEHYKVVLSSLLGASCLNNRRTHGSRVFNGDYNAKNVLASEQIRLEHDRIQNFWKEEDIYSFLKLLNNQVLSSTWHLLIFSASNKPSIHHWFRSKLGLKCSSNPSIWSSTHNILNRDYTLLMPETLESLPTKRMCYGACIYDLGLVEENAYNSPSMCNGLNSEKSAMNDPLRDDLFSFLRVVSNRTTTKFPLLLVMWTKGDYATENYVERLKFMDIITSSWSAVSSIHVLTIKTIEDAKLGESLKLLLSNVSSEQSPSFQVEQVCQINRKREAEIQLNATHKKRPVRRTIPLFQEEVMKGRDDFSYALSNPGNESDSLTLLREKIKKAQELLNKVQTTK